MDSHQAPNQIASSHCSQRLVARSQGQFKISAAEILIAFYRLALKPFMHAISGPGFNSCRHVPHCSEFAEQTLRSKGLVRGLLPGVWRVLSCNPFNQSELR